ncbi:sugar phosphate isomerase/epimerase family protein [Actinomyces procaprae]|uniref:sugar phosphate isomerase/epimerase family protein n=1 Tax=Actinomyces procaprae TaxID=2560010 RepID=UPI00109E30CC|nr:sugar phosphate isomerase/epimerase family protein [Actinomyces procaprae]
MTYTCKHTSADWPIAAAMLPFPGSQDADEAVWRKQLAQVRFEGFTAIDLTDNWVRIADLSRERLALLKGLLEEYGLTPVAVSAIRRSVIDPVDWEGNLAYSHRVIDAAAFLGAEIVSVGLHRPLLDAQARALWFWTQPGPVDSHDPDNWRRAVTRLRELGEHVERAGMALSLEMYEDTLLGTADSAVRLVTDIDMSSVGLNPDLGNIYRLHRPIEDFLVSVEKCMPHANYWHMKSYSRDVDAEGHVTTVPAPMAFGTANYRQAIQIATDAGFDGPMCVENYGGDGLTVSAENMRYIRRMLAVALNEI